MTETVQPPEDAAAARAAEQTRLRKERREAKIRAGGTARLNKITGLGGGLQREPEPQAAAQPATATAPSTTSTPPAATAALKHDDPEEVDISQHYYAPRTTGRAPPPGDEPSMSEAQLRQMMLGFDRSPPGIGTPPSRNPVLDPSRAGNPSGMPPPMPPGMEGMENDPMMQMLQKMMAGGGAPGGAGGANPFAGTGMESLLGGLGGMGGMGGAGDPSMQQAAQAVADKTANIWRIIHAVFALGLGFYVALSTTFTGLKSERDMLALSIDDDENADLRRSVSTFFYLFSSVEAILLTSRYFLDKHRSPPSGIMWSLVGFLPAPLGSTIRHGLKYSQMFSTVRNDALFCVFVLGVCCWLRS